eukprot:TRINITY_DN422_c0_g1_i1.p1 TRINITY_DN422_c0_g1~~TRINITY_DN422_c0_g1_i1.p1  ORF type:complete len:299 (-),score=99.72 TRINITY_DN422_c0_g1_i1:7-903(-)
MSSLQNEVVALKQELNDIARVLGVVSEVRSIRKEIDSITVDFEKIKKAGSSSTTASKPAPTTSSTTTSKPAEAPKAAQPAQAAPKPVQPAVQAAPKPVVQAAPKPAQPAVQAAPKPAVQAAPKPTQAAAPAKPSVAVNKPVARPGPGAKPAGNAEPSVVNIKDQATVQDTCKQVREDKGIDWLLVGYTDNKNNLQLEKTGTGGLKELRSHLKPDNQFYGLLRVDAAGSNSVKIVYIVWSGENVPGLRKARVSTHKAAVKDIFGQSHVTVAATDLDEISDANVEKTIRHAAGSQYDKGY